MVGRSSTNKIVESLEDREDPWNEPALTPEQKLLAGMIGRAVLDCSGPRDRPLQAIDWLIVEAEREVEPLREWGFNWVAQKLGLSEHGKQRVKMMCCQKKADFRVNVTDLYN